MHTIVRSSPTVPLPELLVPGDSDADSNAGTGSELQRFDVPASRWKPTGAAFWTAKRHSKENELRFLSACFCPYSQRVWIALQAKGLQYQYCEVDPFMIPKPAHLSEGPLRGTVPAIYQGGWCCAESSVILEFLEDLDKSVPLLPADVHSKAHCRLWIDFINSQLVPSFNFLLNATDSEEQDAGIERLQADITDLVQNADEQGPFFLGGQMCLVDIHFAPFALRLERFLQPYRGWTPPSSESRWERWIKAMEANPHIKDTLSTPQLYVDTMSLLMDRSEG